MIIINTFNGIKRVHFTPLQQAIYFHLKDPKNNNTIIDKGRQEGVSTVIAYYLAEQLYEGAITGKHKNFYILS